MKILVIQTARLGDIFKTWPVIRGLKRKYSDSKIDVLTRDKFSIACKGLKEIDEVIELETKAILEPLFVDQDEESSVLSVQRFCSGLIDRDYDLVINLSFSSMTSYMAFLLEDAGSKIRGYSRHTDGSLKFSCNESSYFYAQVGVDKFNRKHLGDVFADLAGVSPLIKSDFDGIEDSLISRRSFIQENEKYIVVHMGASEKEKVYDVADWTRVLFDFLSMTKMNIVLIGSDSERFLGEELIEFIDSSRVNNLMGETEVFDLFSIIQDAKLLVGGDSVPMHIAALTKTKCLNLSFSSVNFRETGPRSTDSCVLVLDKMEELPGCEVSDVIVQMVEERPIEAHHYIYSANMAEYLEKNGKVSNGLLEWKLIEILYNRKNNFEEIRHAMKGDQLLALEKLKEVNEVAVNQLKLIKKNITDGKGDIKVGLNILDRVDEIIDSIIAMCPVLKPIKYWYEAEKVGVGPGLLEEIIRQTEIVHDKLNTVLESISSGRKELSTSRRDDGFTELV